MEGLETREIGVVKFAFTAFLRFFMVSNGLEKLFHCIFALSFMACAAEILYFALSFMVCVAKTQCFAWSFMAWAAKSSILLHFCVVFYGSCRLL